MIVDAVAGDISGTGIHAVLESVLGFLLEISGSVPFATIGTEGFTPGGRVALAITWEYRKYVMFLGRRMFSLPEGHVVEQATSSSSFAG